MLTRLRHLKHVLLCKWLDAKIGRWPAARIERHLFYRLLQRDIESARKKGQDHHG